MALSQFPSPRQILFNFVALFSGMGLARVATAVALILLARQVGPESYGQYVACFSLAKLTSVCFSWGLDGWLLWRGGRSENLGIIAQNSGVALALKLVLGIVWFILLYMAAGWLNPTVFPRVVVITTGLIVWADDLTNTVWSVFKSTLQNDITFRVITSVQILLVLVTIVLILLDAQQLMTFLWARVVVTMLGCLIAISMLRVRVGLLFDWREMWPTLRLATPFAASLFFALIYERVDVTIIGQFLGTEQAGLYGPAATVTTSLFLIPSSVYAVMVPVLTRAYAGDAKRYLSSFRLLLSINVALGIGLALGLALSAHWIAHTVFGAQYRASGEVLTILSLVLGLRCVTFALAAAIVAAGLQANRIKAQALAAFLSIFVNLAIVQKWGIEGVAWVYVLTEFVLMLGYWWVLASLKLNWRSHVSA